MLQSLLLIWALLAAPAIALYDKGGPVTLLTHRSFSSVTDSKVPVVVEFFAPWCGHCKSLAPAYAKAATKLQGIVPFVAIDCDKESNRPLCSQYGVQGFPTIKLFTPRDKGPASATDYQGERSAKGLADAALGLLTTKHVKRIKSEEEAAAFAAAPGTKVVLVSDKADTPAMFKSFSQRFAPQGLAFGRVQAASGNSAAAAQLLAALGGPVDSLPALLALKADGSRTVYDGPTKAPLILEWLKQVAGGGAKSGGAASAASSDKAAGAGKEKAGASKEEGEQKKKEVPAQIPQVVDSVSAAELTRRLEKDGVVLAAFYKGSEAGCRESLNKLNAAVHGLHGLASGMQVNISDDGEEAVVKDLFSIELPPASEAGCEMKAFLVPYESEDHEDADEWRPWLGDMAAKELHKAAVELFPAVGITRLTAESYATFAAMTDVGRAKIILFTDKEEPPAVYRTLSANFRGYKMDFALASAADKPLMEQFNVQKVPYLLALFAHTGGEDGQPAAAGQQVQVGVQPYMGPVRYATISTWLTIIGMQTGTAPEETLRQFGKQSQDAMVAQVSDPDSWQASCLSKGGVCIVAALSASPEEQAAQLETLRAAAAGRVDQALHFCWFQLGTGPGANSGSDGSGEAKSSDSGGSGGNAASDLAATAAAARRFAEQLGLGEGGAAAGPALVAVAPRKQRTAVMTACFDKASISEWLDGLLSGKVRTSSLHQLPAYPSAAEAAGGGGNGGEAGEEAAVEEEFDLSDIMNEEVEGDLSKSGRKDEL